MLDSAETVAAFAREMSEFLRTSEITNSRLRDEFLAVEQFDSLLEAQVLIGDWRIEYNTKRPHSGLGWLAPAAYAERWEAQQHAGLS